MSSELQIKLTISEQSIYQAALFLKRLQPASHGGAALASLLPLEKELFPEPYLSPDAHFLPTSLKQVSVWCVVTELLISSPTAIQ